MVLVAPPVGLAEAQAVSVSTGPSFDLLADESVTDMQVSRAPVRVPAEYRSSTREYRSSTREYRSSTREYRSSTRRVPFEYPSSTVRVPVGYRSGARRALLDY